MATSTIRTRASALVAPVLLLVLALMAAMPSVLACDTGSEPPPTRTGKR